VHNLETRIAKVDKSSIKSPKKVTIYSFFVNGGNAKIQQMRRLIARKITLEREY
tara:strand:- start:1985 stop:2146 length:162 start_codon:yes stop_codon:yes gene_type:complete